MYCLFILNLFDDLAVEMGCPMSELSDNSSAIRAKRSIKSTLIEPFRQIKFGLYVISASILFVIIVALMFLMAFYEQYLHVMNLFNMTDVKDQMELVTNDIFYRNAIAIGLMLIAFVVGMFILMFKLTHRYYGPLVSIERFVEQMTQGKYNKRVNIRKGDELQRLANLLNNMATTLEKGHQKSR